MSLVRGRVLRGAWADVSSAPDLLPLLSHHHHCLHGSRTEAALEERQTNRSPDHSVLLEEAARPLVLLCLSSTMASFAHFTL